MFLTTNPTLTAWDFQRTFYGHSPEEVSRRINDFIRSGREGGWLNSYVTGSTQGAICDPSTRDEWEFHAIFYYNKN